MDKWEVTDVPFLDLWEAFGTASNNIPNSEWKRRTLMDALLDKELAPKRQSQSQCQRREGSRETSEQLQGLKGLQETWRGALDKGL